MIRTCRNARFALSRSLGAVVCSMHGCRYFYANGAIATWCAYSCVRCGKFDRDLDSLPDAPGDGEDYEGYFDHQDDDQIEADRRQDSRWLDALPLPRWL